MTAMADERNKTTHRLVSGCWWLIIPSEHVRNMIGGLNRMKSPNPQNVQPAAIDIFGWFAYFQLVNKRLIASYITIPMFADFIP